MDFFSHVVDHVTKALSLKLGSTCQYTHSRAFFVDLLFANSTFDNSGHALRDFRDRSALSSETIVIIPKVVSNAISKHDAVKASKIILKM